MSEYRDYVIEHNPPPIPVRSHDWQFWHRDYDGPEDDRLGEKRRGRQDTDRRDDRGEPMTTENLIAGLLILKPYYKTTFSGSSPAPSCRCT